VTARDDVKSMKEALATALHGLERGDIRLGGRKRRGYGQCNAGGWRAWRYDLTRPEDFRGWLAHDRTDMTGHQAAQWTANDAGESILSWDALAGVTTSPRAAEPFTLSATFAIDGSVLIRSGFEAESGPDVMHLTSRREGEANAPVMSGTSLAGVMRGQALRIARTVAAPAGEEGRRRADDLVRGMFGYMQRLDELPPTADGRPPDRRLLRKQASRVTIDESEITGPPKHLVQTRVKIDRFTGGAFESALFAEQPAFGGKFTLGLALRRPTIADVGLPSKQPTTEEIEKALDERMDAEVGLLLLLLKDLWTGFLPVGGGSSVGRGRLKGKAATLRYGGEMWTLTADGDNGESITVSSDKGTAATKLNEYVQAFKQQMTGRA
jgi:CRISPR/Cas system CSM-associated protein Csm3 (group 7 of RAMP superfamily)